ncbi:SinR family protein [Flexivirga caeni]|uniref:SinR family protein n=1 Tax=Flexivirga caeni TaxID=2294115 RepID=A0A3M9M6A6_9MICO|nr:SinR family protein [Flexivirga caeni]RNI20737.1 SinR family protein [Flexivirga caeni]
MNTILIGYDLNRQGQDYDDLIASIKALGSWWHHLDSTWLVKTSSSAKEVRDRLARHIDSNDELLVINVSGDAVAWRGFNERGSKWLKDNF